MLGKINQFSMTNIASKLRMPAEWEKHRATWIAWPHEESDWPRKFSPIKWIYAELVRVIGRGELVEILVSNEDMLAEVGSCLRQSDVSEGCFRLHVVPNDRSWLRDSAPTAVFDETGSLVWIAWSFNAWAKYGNFAKDKRVSDSIATVSESGIIYASKPQHDSSKCIAEESLRLVLEGGAIDTDGDGTLLVTEECLLSKEQERNPGLHKADYEALFKTYLGIEKTIWLKSGVVGDDTHGHIDDIVRFVAPGKVVAVLETDTHEANYISTHENLEILRSSTDASGRYLDIISLPMPRPVIFNGERLPASYANFYIANGAILVPTFGDKSDIEALNIFARIFPEREIVGIYCRDFVLGQGTIHCSTQQEPLKIAK